MNRIPFLLTSLRVTLAPIVVALALLAPSRGALGGCLVAAFLSDAFEPSAIADRWRPLAALVVLELTRYAFDFVKFRREASYHMWSSKLWGVLLFAGLTAYDTQRLQNMFASGETSANLPIVGALTLYLDFINMFLFLLRFLGDRRRD